MKARRAAARAAYALTSVLVVVAALLGFAPPAAGQFGKIIPNQYIVVFQDDVTDPETRSDSFARRYGFVRQLVFSRALKGFSAMIPSSLVQAVRFDPQVRYVVPDQEVEALAQTLPPGIQRIGATINPVAAIDGVDQGVPVGIAVIDTGIDLSHPDLKPVAGGCFSASYYYLGSSCSSPTDENGHGTHVAGTAAARDNSAGVVGVAPGATVYAVRVLDRNGQGTLSQVIKGIDWVTQKAATVVPPIRVANLSLGASGSDDGNCGRSNNDPLHEAICRMVAAGIVTVVAAGNSGADASGTIPAAYDEVITVGAIADTDGQPGGLGPSTSYGKDDAFASFSNYGPDVDLVAPGVNVYSTYKGGSYQTLSGTSMASPHVAGAAALYVAQNPNASPDQVRQALIGQGQPGPWPGTPGGYSYPLVYVGAVHDIAVTALSAPAIAAQGDLVNLQVTVKNLGTFEETRTLTVSDKAGGVATALGDPAAIGPLEPGGSTTTTVQWAAGPAGSHTITAAVSPGDDNSGNDSMSAGVTVKVPLHDVAVTALGAPTSATTGQKVTITATVANLGTYTESNFTPSLTDNGTQVDALTVLSLAAGSSTTLNFVWTPPAAGSRSLVAATNLGDGDPANDSRTATVAVSDVPLLVAQVTTDKASYSGGQTVKVTATVKDGGGTAVNGASVQLSIKSPNGGTAASKSGTTNSSGVFAWSWKTSATTRYFYGTGTYTVNAAVSKSGYQSGSATTSFQFQ